MSGVSSAKSPDSSQAVLASPIPGVPLITLRSEQGLLCAVEFQLEAGPIIPPLESATVQAVQLLNNYFRDSHFPQPVLRPVCGTSFQQRVWQLLQQIPVGETRSYAEVAAQLGSGARAVAGACRANPLPILIPCHRVVSGAGLGGYMGQKNGPLLEIKSWLLHHEGHV